MRIWHWKSHWKVQLENVLNPHWEALQEIITLITLKIYCITLKFVCYCYSRMLIPYIPLNIFSVTHILCSFNFSVTLVLSMIFNVIFSLWIYHRFQIVFWIMDWQFLPLPVYMWGDQAEWVLCWEYWFWDTSNYSVKFLLYLIVFSYTKLSISLEP